MKRLVVATFLATLSLWFVGLLFPILALACLSVAGVGAMLARAELEDTREDA